MHYSVVDVVRALLAWTVVAAHVTWYTGLLLVCPRFGIINRFAHLAVLEFVIISGFVITNLVLSSNKSYGPYLARRFFRIYPVHLVCLLAGVITTLLTFKAFETLWQPQSLQAHDLQMIEASLEGRGLLEHLVAHFTLLHGMIPDSSLYYSQMMFLAPAWSLSLEWQFYLLAPFVVRILRTNESIWPYCFVALVLAGEALYVKGFFGAFALPSFLPGASAYFAIGILTRLQLNGELAIRTIRPELLVLVVGMLLLGLSIAPVVIWACMVPAMTGVMAPLAEKLRARPLLRVWETLETLGLHSYSTYLVHVPLIQLAIYFGVLLGLNVWGIVALVLVVGLPATALCSRLLYQHVELPAMRYAKRTF
jgi:peptidoglycan/LPS O-acetylase OafA/YrhL